MNDNEKDNRKSRLVFDARVARRLLKYGYMVIDIKPNRSNPDVSIFIFENTPEFQKALEEVTAEFKAKDEARLKESLERPETAD